MSRIVPYKGGSVWLLLLSFPFYFNSCIFPKHFKTSTCGPWTLVYQELRFISETGNCAPAKAKMWKAPLETWPEVGELFLSPVVVVFFS